MVARPALAKSEFFQLPVTAEGSMGKGYDVTLAFPKWSEHTHFLSSLPLKATCKGSESNLPQHFFKVNKGGSPVIPEVFLFLVN